jgi:hypothetical protein
MPRWAGARTGDIVLFSNNTPTGFLLRTFVSSLWNHSGIAVRLIDDAAAPLDKRISLTAEGELYILETSTGIRYDPLFQRNTVGVGFSPAQWAFSKYNKVVVRPLLQRYRTPLLAELTLRFAQLSYGARFPSDPLPFLAVWLGIPAKDEDQPAGEMFCSEFMAHYYCYCILPQLDNLPADTSSSHQLSLLFGPGAPQRADMFTPGDYSISHTPQSPIFLKAERVIWIAYSDLLYVIMQPLIIILVLAIILCMLLRQSLSRSAGDSA